MKTKLNLTSRSYKRPLLLRNALTGMVIAFAIILFFILQVDVPNPEWPELWMVRPLIITPLAGAFGGALYYIINNHNHDSGTKSILLRCISLLLYLFILWVGIILGLDGTLWD